MHLIVYCDVIVPCAIVNAIDEATIPRDESGVVSCNCNSFVFSVLQSINQN